jgi:hypothetical protein
MEDDFFIEGLTVEFPKVRDKALEKLSEFRLLKKGWHFGEGEPLSEENIALCEALLHTSKSNRLVIYDVFPGINGEVRFTIYEGNEYLEFTIEDNGQIVYLRETNDIESDYQENLTVDDAKQIIRSFSQKLWKHLSESSTRSIIMMNNVVAITAWPFDRKRVGFPFLRKPAPSRRVTESAIISNDFTTKFLDIPLSIGSFQPHYYQMDVS